MPPAVVFSVQPGFVFQERGNLSECFRGAGRECAGIYKEGLGVSFRTRLMKGKYTFQKKSEYLSVPPTPK